MQSNPSSGTSLSEQFRSYNRVFWTGNLMEMFERLSYYGLRTVVPIYMVLSLTEGGLELSHTEKGQVFMWWAAVQSFVPIFTGGYADKYGYKKTVGISIAIKILGYLVMGYALDLAQLFSFTDMSAHDLNFWSFTTGALLLALGTAIFKPGIQGIIAAQLEERTSSLGWSLFYQLVNVGGWLGPFLAGFMRLMSWKWVFISCALIVAINYLFLLTFDEPVQNHEDEEASPEESGWRTVLETGWTTSVKMFEPRLFGFLVIFSGFWMMFFQLFDLLPNYIDDWVDSRQVFATMVQPVFGVVGASPPEAWAGYVPQEHMININAAMCMLFAWLVGYFTGKTRSMYAMILGMAIASMGIYGLGLSTSGWAIIGAIVLFSLGELCASPTKMRYMMTIAPPGKNATYLGYVNATGGIGWSLGSALAGRLYDAHGDKVMLARRYLGDELNWSSEAVARLGRDEVVATLGTVLEQTPSEVRERLFDLYAPNVIWEQFAIYGIVSMFGLIGYDLITRQNHRWENVGIMALTFAVSGYCYGIWWGIAFVQAMALYLLFYDEAPPAAQPSIQTGESIAEPPA
jgi:MFS family permease